MDVLMIGGTGNISSEITPLLLAQGHNVTVLNTGTRPIPAGCRHIKANRFDSCELTNALGGVNGYDVVMDFMAFTPDNCRVVYEALRGKIGQFIFISSATVYQKPHVKIPITEDYPRGNPFWPYAQDKIACEEFLESIHGDDYPVTIVRPSHTFGATWIPSPINSHGFTVSSRILANKPFIIHDLGESLWTLTASSDFAKGFIGLVGNKRALGEAFHITSDEALSWNDIYATLGKALGVKKLNAVYIPSEFLAEVYPEALGMLMGDKKENGVFDNSKIKRFVPSFKCEKTFATAIEQSVAWHLENPARQTVDPEEEKLIESIISAFESKK